MHIIYKKKTHQKVDYRIKLLHLQKKQQFAISTKCSISQKLSFLDEGAHQKALGPNLTLMQNTNIN